MARGKSEYDESKIKTLSALEHIRLRPGMYIGRLGDGTNFNDGIYVLLKEVVDNSVDEFIMGKGSLIDIKVDGHKIVVRDYGRGIPLGKVVDCVSIINTGAKYNDDVFQFSVGLNGVGTKAVNALSSHFKVVSYRDGKYSSAVFSKGSLISSETGKDEKSRSGTYVEFIPDEEIFGPHSFDDGYIEQRVKNYAYLNRGLKIMYNDASYLSKEGLYDLLTAEIGEDAIYPICYHRDSMLEFAFTHTNKYGEVYLSFVNGQHTSDGGTHQSAFREGFLKGVNSYFKKSYTGSDVREGINVAVAVKLRDPVFESQTKNKLGNPKIRSSIVDSVKKAIEDLLYKNRDLAASLESKIKNNERLRKELQAVRKEAKNAAKKTAIKIPNLKDCKYHLGDSKNGEDTMVFITEGQSASGSMVAARDVNTQAIFSLKGKPLNTYGKTRAAIYKNEELYNVMKSLGIEDSIDNLRYRKVIIATDADNDGFHIRNLLLTFFLNYFENLVIAGHVYILETPLFRVRNKKETVYCYSESERDKAVERLTSPEVTRFKGLGEISPKEFGQFIGDDMRLEEVTVDNMGGIQGTLEFFMGKNTSERKSFIMENLV